MLHYKGFLTFGAPDNSSGYHGALEGRDFSMASNQSPWWFMLVVLFLFWDQRTIIFQLSGFYCRDHALWISLR